MLESTVIFDTYKTSEPFEVFLGCQGIPEHFIVVAACKDECVTSLSDDIKDWFAKIGSKEIDKLEYRQGFVFIGSNMKGKGCMEKRATTLEEMVSVTQIFEVDGVSDLKGNDEKPKTIDDVVSKLKEKDDSKS